MKNPLMITLLSTLTLASLPIQAEPDATPAAKFAGEITLNPQRTESDTVAASSDNAKAAAKYIASGSSVGIYDIWFAEQQDNDGDGYHSRFKLFFDIDSRYTNHRIYVTGQLNNGTSTPLFRTEPFAVSGETGNDTYSATVLLTDGYPSTQYDLTLRVYDANSNTLLLTWGPQQDGRMSQLFLEDAGRDQVSNADIQVFEFAYTLHTDRDGDGYFTDADVRIDVDAPQHTRQLYASLFLIDHGDNWIPLRNSAVVTVTGYSNADAIRINFGLDSGFAPQHYRLGVQLHDAYSHNLLLTSTTPGSALARMESVDYDSSYYVVEEVYYEEEHGHSGGATGIVLLAGVIALWRGRKQRK